MEDHQTRTRNAGQLRAEAMRCRRLANSVLDEQTLEALNGMACEYDREAERLAGGNA